MPDANAKNDAKSYRRGNKYTGLMIQLAAVAGCQLRHQASDPKTMRGLCPFHEANKMQNANTLIVNHSEGRFHCQYCKTHGDSTAFIALIWGTSLAETHRLLELNGNHELSMTRPTPVCMREPEASQRMWFRAQNTCLLSRATDYYVQNIVTEVPPLVYMARLGIIAPDTAPSKIGYAKGWGLANFLEETDASADEIAQSPLFRPQSDDNLSERYVASLVMPDLDILNATRWMMLLPPSCPDFDSPWPETPPTPMYLPGQRPYLFGYGATPKRAPCLTLTDDPRIQLVLQVQDIPSCYNPERKEAEKIATRLATKEPRAIALMLHNQQLSQELTESLKAAQPNLKTIAPAPEEFLRLLEPATRNFTEVTGIEFPERNAS